MRAARFGHCAVGDGLRELRLLGGELGDLGAARVDQFSMGVSTSPESPATIGCFGDSTQTRIAYPGGACSLRTM